MKRIEVFSNNELLNDFLEEMENKLPDQYFSIIEVKHGKGRRGEARGDAVWPEINFYCIMFTDSEKTIRALEAILIVIKHNNPVNAIKMFISDAHTVSLKEYRVSRFAENTTANTPEAEREFFPSINTKTTSTTVAHNTTDTV